MRIETFGDAICFGADDERVARSLFVEKIFARIVGDFGGHYKSEILGYDVDAMEHTVMGGPRFTYRDLPVAMPYAQLLFGYVRGDGNIDDLHVSSNDFGMKQGHRRRLARRAMARTSSCVA